MSVNNQAQPDRQTGAARTEPLEECLQKLSTALLQSILSGAAGDPADSPAKGQVDTRHMDDRDDRDRPTVTEGRSDGRMDTQTDTRTDDGQTGGQADWHNIYQRSNVFYYQ